MKLVIDFSVKEDKERLFKTLKGLKPMTYIIDLKENRDNRSGNQNRYYWGVVVQMISEQTGFTTDEVHEILKIRFLKKFITLPTGSIVETVKSTAKLDTKEFENYMDQVRMFAAQELDIVIPLPNEVLEV